MAGGESVRRSGRPKKDSSLDDESGPNSPNIEGLCLEDSNDGVAKVKKQKQSKTDKALKNLRAKQDASSKFFDDFNPAVSRRDKMKSQTTKKPYSAKAKTNVYDAKGCLLLNGLDLCDCLDDDCPGCHFPCKRCKSGKCGHECRINRKWQYDTVEIDGVKGSVKKNPHLVIMPAK